MLFPNNSSKYKNGGKEISLKESIKLISIANEHGIAFE